MHPGKQRKKEQSASAVLEWLAGTHNLLPSFFVDFHRYHQAASERLRPLQDAWRAACDAGNREREQLTSAELRAQVGGARAKVARPSLAWPDLVSLRQPRAGLEPVPFAHANGCAS